MCKCCSWSDWIGCLTSKPPSDFHICSTSRFHIQETTPLLTSKSNCQRFNALHWADLTDWEFHPTVISEARQQRTTMTSSLSVRELCCFSLSHNLINGHPEHPRIKFKKKRKHILFLFLALFFLAFSKLTQWWTLQEIKCLKSRLIKQKQKKKYGRYFLFMGLLAVSFILTWVQIWVLVPLGLDGVGPGQFYQYVWF